MADKKTRVGVELDIKGAERVIKKGREAQQAVDFSKAVRSISQLEKSLRAVEARFDAISKKASAVSGGAGGGAEPPLMQSVLSAATRNEWIPSSGESGSVLRRRATLIKRHARARGEIDPFMPRELRGLAEIVRREEKAKNIRTRVETMRATNARMRGDLPPDLAADPEAIAAHADRQKILADRKSDSARKAIERKEAARQERKARSEERRDLQEANAESRHKQRLRHADERHQQKKRWKEENQQQADARRAAQQAAAKEAKFARMRARGMGLPNPDLPEDIQEMQRMNMVAPGSARIHRMYPWLSLGTIRKGMGIGTMAAGAWSGNPMLGYAAGHAGTAMMGGGGGASALVGGPLTALAAGAIFGLRRAANAEPGAENYWMRAQQSIRFDPNIAGRAIGRRRAFLNGLNIHMGAVGVAPDDALTMASAYQNAAGGYITRGQRTANDVLDAHVYGYSMETAGAMRRAERRGGVLGIHRGRGSSFARWGRFMAQDLGMRGSEIGETMDSFAGMARRAASSGTMTNLGATWETAMSLKGNIGGTQGLRVASEASGFVENIARRGLSGAPNVGTGLLAMQAFGGLDMGRAGGFSADDMWNARKNMEKGGVTAEGLRKLLQFAYRSGGSHGQGMQFASDLAEQYGMQMGPEQLEAVVMNRKSIEWRRGPQRARRGLAEAVGTRAAAADGVEPVAAKMVEEARRMLNAGSRLTGAMQKVTEVLNRVADQMTRIPGLSQTGGEYPMSTLEPQ